MLRLLICDDHAIVRRGLRQIFDAVDDIEVSGEADGGVPALHMLHEEPDAYDMMLLDISMPDRNGLEVLKQVRREFPKMPVIMFTMHAEDEFGVRTLKAGAAGFVNKRAAPAELVGAIRQVACGRHYFRAGLVEDLADQLANGTQGPLHRTLSSREYQTFCLIASGRTLAETAQQLSLSPKTVSVYRARMLEKLHLRNNAEVMHYAMRHQLIDIASGRSNL